jgi:hypothetical protein
MKNSKRANPGGMLGTQKKRMSDLHNNANAIVKSPFKSNLVKTVNKRVNNPYKL